MCLFAISLLFVFMRPWTSSAAGTSPRPNPETKELQTRNLRVEISRSFPTDLGIPPLELENLLEPNPLNTGFLACGLAAHLSSLWARRRIASAGWPHTVAGSESGPGLQILCREPCCENVWVWLRIKMGPTVLQVDATYRQSALCHHPSSCEALAHSSSPHLKHHRLCRQSLYQLPTCSVLRSCFLFSLFICIVYFRGKPNMLCPKIVPGPSLRGLPSCPATSTFKHGVVCIHTYSIYITTSM